MITDAMLKQAATEAAIKLNDSLPNPEECKHEYSHAFEKRIKKLTHHVAHPIFFRLAQVAACLVLTITLGFSSVMVVNADAREAVFNWIKQAYQTVYCYFSNGEIDQTNCETPKYRLGWIPTEYKLESVMELGKGEIQLFSNIHNDALSFQYNIATEGGTLTIEKDGCSIHQIEINGVMADVYLANDPVQYSSIVWIKDGTLFCISGFLSEEQLVQTAECVTSSNDIA